MGKGVVVFGGGVICTEVFCVMVDTPSGQIFSNQPAFFPVPHQILNQRIVFRIFRQANLFAFELPQRIR